MIQPPNFGNIAISTISTRPSAYTPHGYDRSNDCSFLTSANLKTCTVCEKCIKYECLCDFGVGLLGTPEKRARGPISPKLDPKSRKHSELV